VQFRKTGNAEHVPAVVIGVIERFVEPDLRVKLKDADDDLRLIEDLGIDSLTMMEIVILVEDVLQMTINNDELRNLRTVGDVKTFIDCKIRGLPLPKPTKFIPIEHIGAVMPIQPPFLFLNEASVSSTARTENTKSPARNFFSKVTSRTIRHARFDHARGAWPARGALSPRRRADRAGQDGQLADDFLHRLRGVRAHRICRPGDILTLSIKPKRMKMRLRPSRVRFASVRKKPSSSRKSRSRSASSTRPMRRCRSTVSRTPRAGPQPRRRRLRRSASRSTAEFQRDFPST